MTKLVLARITDLIDKSHVKVEDAVVEALATRELDRRKGIIIKGLDALVLLQQAFDGVNKPDQTMFQDGKPVTFTTQKRVQEQQGAKKKLDQMEQALGEALGEGKTGNLEKQLKGGSGGGGNNASEDNQ